MSGFAANAYPFGYNVRTLVRSLSTAAVALTLPANCIQFVLTNVTGNTLRIYGTRPVTTTSGVTIGAVAAGDVGTGYTEVPINNATVTRSLITLPCARANAIVAVGAGKATIRGLCYIGATGPNAQPGPGV